MNAQKTRPAGPLLRHRQAQRPAASQAGPHSARSSTVSVRRAPPIRNDTQAKNSAVAAAAPAAATMNQRGIFDAEASGRARGALIVSSPSDSPFRSFTVDIPDG